VQGIDWDAIQIERQWEEEGPQETICEDGVYDKLGLKQEDKKEKKATEEASGRRARSEPNDNYVDDLLCEDHV
jgi:hypothetical protein